MEPALRVRAVVADLHVFRAGVDVAGSAGHRVEPVDATPQTHPRDVMTAVIEPPEVARRLDRHAVLIEPEVLEVQRGVGHRDLDVGLAVGDVRSRRRVDRQRRRRCVQRGLGPRTEPKVVGQLELVELLGVLLQRPDLVLEHEAHHPVAFERTVVDPLRREGQPVRTHRCRGHAALHQLFLGFGGDSHEGPQQCGLMGLRVQGPELDRGIVAAAGDHRRGRPRGQGLDLLGVLMIELERHPLGVLAVSEGPEMHRLVLPGRPDPATIRREEHAVRPAHHLAQGPGPRRLAWPARPRGPIGLARRATSGQSRSSADSMG